MPNRLWLALLFLALTAPLHGETMIPDAIGGWNIGARDSLILTTADRSSLASFEDLSVRLTEIEGHEVTVRVSPVDASNREIGSGRLLMLFPSERREIRLRDKFAPEALASARLQIEVLRGEGRVSVSAGNAAGRILIPEPHAAASKRRAVSPHVQAPSSFDLIDQAEASAKLDSETALLYRVYAIHGDARLPAPYRGEDQPAPDSLYMTDVRTRFDSLSATTQALVAPFLIPPAYQESWVNIKAGAPPAVHASRVLPPCHISNSWAHVDATDSPVRVWYDSDNLVDAANAGRAAAEMDKIWPIEIGLMHKGGTAGFPISDAPESCNGGDEKVDIYLTDFLLDVDGLATRYGFCTGAPTAGYIEVTRAAATATLIHELFHVIQMSFPLGACETNNDYRWWTEGSATWAIDYVATAAGFATQDEQTFANYYVMDPREPLDFPEGFYAKHAYSTYLLPFFVSRSTGNADFVRAAWANCLKERAIEAFNDAVPGGLDKVWPEFATHNWNRPPVDDYEKWDKLYPKVVAEKPDNSSQASEIDVWELDYALPHTTATYFHFDFTNLAESSVVFWNGATTKLAERDISGGALGPQYVTDAASDFEIKGAHVTALLRTGSSWRQEDWTSKPFVMFCRDAKDNTFDELVIVISNSDFTNRDGKLKPPARPPILFVSTVGCYQWKGTVTSNNGGMTTSADVTFTRIAQSAYPTAVNYTAVGGLEWSIKSDGCNAAGSLDLGSGGAASLTTYNFLPPDNPAHGTYIGAGLSATTKACGNPVAFFWWTSPPQPLLPGIPLARWLRLTDGDTMEDAFDVKGGHWQWHLERETQH